MLMLCQRLCAVTIICVSMPVMAEEIKLKTFDLDSITSIAPSKKEAPSQGANTLKDCLLDPKNCTDAKFKSNTNFSMDDVVNLKIVKREDTKKAAATDDQTASLDVKAPPAPLPSIDMEILFEYNSDAIRPDQYAQLRLLADTLSAPEFANFQIAVIGHTDAKGSSAYNIDLSQRRATQVANTVALISGIPQTRLSAIGMGFGRLKSVTDPYGAQNRRVQIVLIPKG